MAKYQITEIEGITLHEDTPDYSFVGITQATIERIFKLSKHPADDLCLYTFYAYVCKWQKNTSAYANGFYVMKKLQWGKSRFLRTKASLMALGLIENDKRREGGRLVGHFIKVKYALSTTGTKNHPVENTTGGKQPTETIYLQSETTYSHLGTNYSQISGEKNVTPPQEDDFEFEECGYIKNQREQMERRLHPERFTQN